MKKWPFYSSLTYSRRLTRSPYASIIIAVCALGAEGKLLNHDQAFLTSRTFTVRVGGATNVPWSISYGVQQGSFLSSFLFRLALAPLTKCLPQTAVFPVCLDMYAQDVGLYKRGPTLKRSSVRACMQQALQCVATFVRSINLMISAPKTIDRVVHHHAEA
ncbi:uncharacterized protein LOC142775154 [Rhipicephalus microplus]|uniref:uncharacterized protein LOC142775154 n=1 Tax=Rhipicephalus microplus TaxID=6941 RepID=UPI003F6B7435